MERRDRQYDIMVSLSIPEGCFNSIADVMKYVEYRLNLRGRDTHSIRLTNIMLLKESNVQYELPLGDSLTHGG